MLVFSSIVFLYYFLPIVIVLYFITPMPNGSPKLRNITLLLASIVFYGWGEPIYLLLMVAEIFILWLFGLKIDKYRGTSKSKLFLILSIVVGLGILGFFKYTDFFLNNVNRFTHINLPLLRLALPIGISFYTFQTLSYSIDLYWGKTKVQKNPLDFATYVMLFPQLIAGPIVRYVDVAAKLKTREHTLERFSSGSRRFIVGLAKKVLISNLIGELAQIMYQSQEPSILGAWMYIIAYTLHIYFDFSAYSDMAIGMGRMFGFDFLENFNYPYTAKSITEFWRKWHISLSSWFRDYVYIPLGGNRTSRPRFIFNILFVWFLTGFWHGAGWNFIFWGLYYGILLLIEKFFLEKLLNKTFNWLKHIYVMLIVMVGWVLFDTSNLLMAKNTLAKMFGFGADIIAGEESLYYLRSYLVLFIIAIIGSTPFPKRIAAKFENMKAMVIVEPLYIAALLIISTAFLVDGSFNPFIYFRF